MPRLVDVGKVEHAVNEFKNKIVDFYKGDDKHWDLEEEPWHQIAYGFFVAFGLDIFEIDKALDFCRERGYYWTTQKED